ncbi:MAG: hypothetical protein MJE66_05980 [Proteobacteria bacterium]|nr:hypothetical protein [Pseudomonadota bacterium]
MGRIGIRIANGVLFVLCCFFAAGLFNRVAAAWLAPPVSVPPPAVQRADPATRRLDPQVILQRNLFAASVEGPQLPVVEAPVDLADTKLPLRLLGTAAAEDPALSFAAIEEKGKREHEVVKIGDFLKHHSQVKVHSIEPRRVVLDNRGRLEELVLEDEGPRVARSRPSPRRSASRLADRVRKLSGRDLKVRERSDPRSRASLFSQARIVPRYEDGEMLGLELKEIQEGSFYEQMGLEDGDILRKFNDIEINSPAAGAKILNEFSDAEEFVVTVRKPDGTETTETLTAEQVVEAMAQ